MRILVTNAYTWGNKGDAGILLGTIDLLRSLYGKDLEVDILSFSRDLDREHYLQIPNVHGVYENLICPYAPNPLHIPGGIRNLLSGTWQRFLLAIRSPGLLGRESYQAISEADFVIACGGGYLGGDCFSLNYLQLFLIDTCLKLHKKVVMMGNSVEPCQSSYIRRRLYKTLSRLDTVFARESVTFRFLTEQLQLQNVMTVPDLAFMLNPENPDFQIRQRFSLKPEQPLIGITVRNCSSSPEKLETYISTIAKVIEQTAEALSSVFVFIPQVRFREDDDLQIAKAVRARLPQALQCKFILLEEDYAPSVIKGLIGQCDYFFGTRMHSNIFATSMAVPTVAVAYEQKTNGIMHMLELDDYVLDVNTLDAAACCDCIEKCIRNGEDLSRHLQKRIPEIQENIRNTIIPYLKNNFPPKG